MARRVMWVLWPAFLMAIPAVGVFFSLVDPVELHIFGESLAISRLGAYTLGFFGFWVFGAGCSALTSLLSRSPFEVNRCPLPLEDRPAGCPKRGLPGGCA